MRSVACNYKVSYFAHKQNGLFQKWHLEHFARDHAFSQDGDDQIEVLIGDLFMLILELYAGFVNIIAFKQHLDYPVKFLVTHLCYEFLVLNLVDFPS